jgi:hypothetical protein
VPTEDGELDIALCYLIGFGIPVDLEVGLEYLIRAAKSGNVRARAIALRMHRAHKVTLPEGIPWAAWLSEATSAGSRIAAEDLRLSDHTQYQVSIETFRRKHLGKISQYMVPETLDFFFTLFPVQEPTKCAQAITEWIADNKHGHENIKGIEYRGWTVLHFAAAYGYTDTVIKLLDMGMNIDEPNLLRETALLCACRAGRLAVVKLLLERGANATTADYGGTTPLHYSIGFDSSDIQSLITLLITKGAGVHATSQPFDYTFSPVQWIGEIKSYCGTPLNWAIDANRLDIVHALLDHGADPLRDDGLFEQIGKLDLEMTSGKKTFSPLHFAFQRSQADMLELFFRQAAVKNAAFSTGSDKLSLQTAMETLPLELM